MKNYYLRRIDEFTQIGTDIKPEPVATGTRVAAGLGVPVVRAGIRAIPTRSKKLTKAFRKAKKTIRANFETGVEIGKTTGKIKQLLSKKRRERRKALLQKKKDPERAEYLAKRKFGVVPRRPENQAAEGEARLRRDLEATATRTGGEPLDPEKTNEFIKNLYAQKKRREAQERKKEQEARAARREQEKKARDAQLGADDMGRPRSENASTTYIQIGHILAESLGLLEIYGHEDITNAELSAFRDRKRTKKTPQRIARQAERIHARVNKRQKAGKNR